MPRLGQLARTVLERFEARYTPEPTSGCWLWLGALSGSRYGYGQFRTGKGAQRVGTTAHRASWELFRGPIPEGLFVCHHCDTPGCVNPSHLFLGTHQQNMDDARRKGRPIGGIGPRVRGVGHHNAKLTEPQVLAIRSDGRGGHDIAATYGISQSTVWNIKQRHTWAHLAEASVQP